MDSLHRIILTACFPHPSLWRDTQAADQVTASARSYRAAFNHSSITCTVEKLESCLLVLPGIEEFSSYEGK